MAPRSSTLDPATQDVLARSTIEGLMVHLPNQLDPKGYQRVKKALAAIGGKWDRAAQAHVFQTDPADALALMVATGRVQAPEHKLSSFWPTPTPDPLADQLAERFADAPRGSTVLEPSAGDGALVRALTRANEDLRVIAVEVDADRAACIDADEVYVCRFEDWVGEHDTTVAGIIMNPPFTLPGQHLAWLDHLDIALDYLQDTGGGDLAAIVPASLEYRNDHRTSAMRNRIEDLDGGITALPAGSFQVSGTGVATLLVEVEVQ